MTPEVPENPEDLEVPGQLDALDLLPPRQDEPRTPLGREGNFEGRGAGD